jgi:hypothetical protein
VVSLDGLAAVVTEKPDTAPGFGVAGEFVVVDFIGSKEEFLGFHLLPRRADRTRGRCGLA